MKLISESTKGPGGGGFLLEPVGSRPVMAPEFFTDEQRAFFDTARRFSQEDVLPKAARIEKKDFQLLRELLAKAGELGLLGIDIDEAWGGSGLDKTTSLLVAEAKSMVGSWSVTFAAQTCIGTLPIAWFGNDAQKKKYLPDLASGRKVSAYALTEAGSGSDALGAKTKAVKSADGKHWLLTGSKQYITNAGFADVFVVFAKIDGEHFSGFIVDRDTPGLTVGPEEHKMGIRGSSTCPLILEEARVPVENLLGEPGKGHKIAFNILNLGRLKLGAGVLGGMKLHLAGALNYVADRKQFDTPIVRFGLTREKLARMLTCLYAVESMAYRTSGLIDDAVAGGAKLLEAIEEYNVEASILKVLGSEALGALIDDGVQLHGGAGYIEEYPIERAYRDARINRIFEGTNEINRLLITGTLLKRTLKGKVDLFGADVPTPSPKDAPVENLKKVARLVLQAAVEAHGPKLEHHQAVLAAVSDLIMDAFALDAMAARNRQLEKKRALAPWRTAALQRWSNDAHARALHGARKALSSCVKGDELTQRLKDVEALLVWLPFDAEANDEVLAAAVESARGYPDLTA
ncbi:MAG: acyl-CoA dehydrogenase family protein [Myxococcaceae bacterium]